MGDYTNFRNIALPFHKYVQIYITKKCNLSFSSNLAL